MHYISKFMMTTSDGKEHTSPTIGAAYALLQENDRHFPSASIRSVLSKDGTSSIVHLVFEHLENLIVDLYRMGKEKFHLRSYHLLFSDDGEFKKYKSEDQVLSLRELQNLLISNYAHLDMPIHLELNLDTKQWVYFGGFGSQKKFEIFEEKA